MLQSGMTYYKGRAGLQSQLSPIPPGYGSPAQNPATYTGGPSPGYPNWDAPGSGPYTPPFAPFPQGFQNPLLTTFNVSLIYSGSSFAWAYQTGVSPPNTQVLGSLNSGGGQGGITTNAFEVASNGAVQLYLFAPVSLFATSPFAAAGAATAFFSKLVWSGQSPATQTLVASTASYTHGSNVTDWWGNWASGSGGGDINSGSDVTLTVTAEH